MIDPLDGQADVLPEQPLHLALAHAAIRADILDHGISPGPQQKVDGIVQIGIVPVRFQPFQQIPFQPGNALLHGPVIKQRLKLPVAARLHQFQIQHPVRRLPQLQIDQPGTQAYMAVSFSSDGLDWCDPIPWPEYNPPADSHNLPFWDEEQNCYALLSRIWKDGIRITTLSRCKDFLHWSEPQETLRGNGFENQIYAMPAFRWGNLYLGLASMIDRHGSGGSGAGKGRRS